MHTAWLLKIDAFALRTIVKQLHQAYVGIREPLFCLCRSQLRETLLVHLAGAVPQVFMSPVTEPQLRVAQYSDWEHSGTCHSSHPWDQHFGHYKHTEMAALSSTGISATGYSDRDKEVAALHSDHYRFHCILFVTSQWKVKCLTSLALIRLWEEYTKNFFSKSTACRWTDWFLSHFPRSECILFSSVDEQKTWYLPSEQLKLINLQQQRVVSFTSGEASGTSSSRGIGGISGKDIFL